MALPGCAQQMLELSEEETAAILGEIDARVATERAEALEILDAPYPVARVDKKIDVPDEMHLGDALRIAAGHNRDLRTRSEAVILSAVTLRNAQNDVGLRMSGSINYLVTGGDDVDRSKTSGATLGLTDLLPTGAEVTVRGSADKRSDNGDAPSSANGFWEIAIRQPLLSGFGYEASHERLTDAEQQALYDVRDFDLSRQDLAIRVQTDFYFLVSQQRVIKVREETRDSLEFLKKSSEALFEVGRASEIDKFRATRDFLNEQNNLIDAQQLFDTRLDRFKILLGLDTETDLAIADELPEPTPFEVPLDRILDVALVNRLELMTRRDQVQDAERRVRIREQELLPQLDIEAVNRRASKTERHYDDLSFDRDRYSLGVSLELPLDRVRERGNVRRARIELDRARRDLALNEDNVLAEARDSLRSLRSAEYSFDIQQQVAASEEKNVRIAQLRFEQGKITNRDVTDALTNRTDAQIRVVRERVRVATARLQLLRDAGVMFMKEDGSWVDLAQARP